MSKLLNYSNVNNANFNLGVQCFVMLSVFIKGLSC